MDRYLSGKAKNVRVWDIPVAVISGMITLLMVCVGFDDLWKGKVPREDLAAMILAAALMVWLLSLPLTRIIRWRLRQRLARRISARLSQRDEDAIPLEALDAATGVRGAARKVKRLIRKGFLQKLAIDEDAQCLRLDNPKPEPAPEAAPTGYDDTLARIRELNDAIADETVSAHIARIETVTADIFRAIEDDPARAAEARRFMSYYLPTTLKLLETYDLMEDQSFQGENIQASRRRIEGILAKLVVAVERQQDKLFRAAALDVDAEVSAMEAMMTSDGLAVRGEGDGGNAE